MGLEPFIIIMKELKLIGLMLEKRVKYRRGRETNKWLHRVLLQLRRVLLLLCRVLQRLRRVLLRQHLLMSSQVETRQVGCAIQSVGRTNVRTQCVAVREHLFPVGCWRGIIEDHVWFEDRWMVASMCDE
jgi:hypothetical protein